MELEGTKQVSVTFRPISGALAQRELEKLLARHFPVPAQGSFYDDFPVWDERFGKKIFRIGAYSGQRLVASASVRLAELRVPHGPLPVALIGAVVTEEEFRGQGLASETVARAIQWALQSKAAAVFLWGSEHSLYQRMGFELCGAQVRIPLASILATRSKIAARVNEGWNPAIMKLLEKREQGLVLQATDQPWIEAHKNVRWFWTGEASAPSAYAAFGKGMDLAGLVHEWGGTPASCIEIFRSIHATAPDAALLGAPARMDFWQFEFEDSSIEYLTMAKVLDPRAIHAAYHGQAPLPHFPVNPNDLPGAFFGPFVTGALPAGLYPVPLWLWGLDGA
jgi:GNAT superfamily N-acetyltransferase